MSVIRTQAPDARLRLVAKVSRARDADGSIAWVVGHYGRTGPAPYGRIAGSDLLLPEILARTPLAISEEIEHWILWHGSFALGSLWKGEVIDPPVMAADGWDFADALTTAPAMRDLARWHLRTLANLSLPDRSFDPAWMSLRITSSAGSVDVSAPEAGAPVVFSPVDTDDVERPAVWVPREEWARSWGPAAAGRPTPDLLQGGGRLTADRDGLIELERRLLGPWLDPILREKRYSLGFARGFRGAVAIHEHLYWSSVMAPVMLQLIEGLQRVSEGHSGAAFCRECEQPYLTLDARRSGFCTEAERNRNSQRRYRGRRAEARLGQDIEPDGRS